MGILVEFAPLCGRLIRPARFADRGFFRRGSERAFLDAGFAPFLRHDWSCLGPYI